MGEEKNQFAQPDWLCGWEVVLGISLVFAFLIYCGGVVFSFLF